MDLARIPLFEALAPHRRILVAGAGGGFDIYAGIPLVHALEERGAEVHLANYSFADLTAIEGGRPFPHVVEVTAQSVGALDYLPERLLARWYKSEGSRRSVWSFEAVGVAPLKAAYQALVSHLQIDALVLVDGGTDSLMRGDEAGLGTPAEDICSIAAVHALELPTKLLSCVGFGVDRYHGVCHAQFLEAVAELTRSGAYLGALTLLPGMEASRAYLRAVEHIDAAGHRPSIVNSSIAAAVEGAYGDVHRTTRTEGSRLWINPLMAQYFSFHLDPVAERILYLPDVEGTETLVEMHARIEAFRRSVAIRPFETIPA